MYCAHCTNKRRNIGSPVLVMLSSGDRSPELRRFGRSPIRAPASRLRRNRCGLLSRCSTNASDVIGPTPRAERICFVCGYFFSPSCRIRLS